ncbi:hypothetical protein MMC13_002044 [Lambiella insularis]|nr:hypothetical protein [Lambiella insularis]
MCIKNIRAITDVGDIPYELVRPVLLKLENPEQLHVLEEASPQLCGADAEIWKEFIKRDIPNWESKRHEPKNPKNWCKVYRKLRTDSQKEVEADAAILNAAMEGIKSERAKHTSKVMDAKSLPKLTREGRVSKAGSSSSGSRSLLTFTSGSKTKTLTGRGVLDKARREARELSLFSAKRSLLTTPTHKLSSKATQIHHAPQALVDEHRRPPAPTYMEPNAKPMMIYAPRKHSTPRGALSPNGIEFEEREKKLRALTVGRKYSEPRSTITSQSVSTSVRSASQRQSNPAYPSSSYVAPRSKPSTTESNAGQQRASKAKAPANPFMPAKRRKIV